MMKIIANEENMKIVKIEMKIYENYELKWKVRRKLWKSLCEKWNELKRIRENKERKENIWKW